jgi:molybdopterin molybdotransferase
MISVEQALENARAGFSPIGCETVSIDQALGRVLGENVASRVTQPPKDVSSMDGYAVRAEDVADVPVTLTRIGESQAGDGFDGEVGRGQTVRTFTGAPIPAGTDAIVIQEVTEVDGDQILIKERSDAGRFVRPAGLDFSNGDVLLDEGTVLSARDIGLLGAMNVPWVKVRRRPRVGIIATGDEVVMPGDPLGPDQIVSSNTLALSGYVTALGGEPVNLGIAQDTVDSLREILAATKGMDLIMTIGGASVGDYDLVQQVMGEKGLKLDFYKVAMRPGKPMIFGHLNDTPVLGLPGNPVSAGVTCVVFLILAMDMMLGIDTADEQKETAVLGRDLGENDQRQDYLRAELTRTEDGALSALPFEVQDSSMMERFAKADCLVIRPPHAEPVKAGERVEIIRLSMGRIGF